MTEQAPPAIFTSFCQFFHQDIAVVYSSIDEAIGDFFGRHTDQQISALKDYLRHRLGSEDVRSLEAEWNNSGAEVDFPEGQIVAFYKSVVEYGQS